jgi:hypothetical protein
MTQKAATLVNFDRLPPSRLSLLHTYSSGSPESKSQLSIETPTDSDIDAIYQAVTESEAPKPSVIPRSYRDSKDELAGLLAEEAELDDRIAGDIPEGLDQPLDVAAHQQKLATAQAIARGLLEELQRRLQGISDARAAGPVEIAIDESLALGFKDPETGLRQFEAPLKKHPLFRKTN